MKKEEFIIENEMGQEPGVSTMSENDAPIIIEPGDGEEPTRPEGGEGEGEGEGDDKKKEPLDPIPNVGMGGL